MKLLIRNGTIIDPASGREEVGDLLCEDGVITAVGGRLEPNGAEVLDAAGKVVVPGFIDLHAHLRDPGFEGKEDIESGTQAAVRGGFTTVCAMPNTSPVVDCRAIVELVLTRAAVKGLCRVCPIGAVSKGLKNEELAEMEDMVAAGAVALTDDAFPIQDSGFLRRVLEYASILGVRVVLHCEDKSLTEGGAMHEGRCSTVFGLKGMPGEAEQIPAERAVRLARLAGTPLHIAHVSSGGTVDILRRAKAEGLDVTAEACPHHFSLTDGILKGYDTNAKVNPPLRTQADVEAIIAGLKDGTIDAIATDHAPHSVIDKEVEFDQAPFGILGLETALGVTLTYLVHPGHLTLSKAVAKLTCNPARVFGLEGGTLSVRSRADVVVFDPQAEQVVRAAEFASKGRNTPYEGMTLRGRVEATVVGGEIRYRS